ncbi:uncharacterized protein [Triticum aestivum]|uniref:uncharacterized protein isoform X3 n=1 Tax=Triticum aestivum TaxID=4565 RepID=UPI001D00BC14|nr:uncharacterized protein LOC123145778 isoform X3 [Triticum aestivum]
MVDDSLPFQCLGAPSSCFTPLENAGIPYLGWCCTAWLSSKFNGDGNCQFWASSVQFYRTPEHRIFVRQQLVKHLESHWLIMRYILDMSLWITENILRRCQIRVFWSTTCQGILTLPFGVIMCSYGAGFVVDW